jgi:hypothetical protein
MHLPEQVVDLIQVVLGRQSGPSHQPVVAGTTLAIHQDELHAARRGGGELAEQVSHQHGLAEPG